MESDMLASDASSKGYMESQLIRSSAEESSDVNMSMSCHVTITHRFIHHYLSEKGS